jgi:hypothetical protein
MAFELMAGGNGLTSIHGLTRDNVNVTAVRHGMLRDESWRNYQVTLDGQVSKLTNYSFG